MQFTATSGGVPVGIYDAEFINLEDFVSDTPSSYGPGVKLSWRILAGEHEDQIASRICSKKFSPKAALRQFAEAIIGRELAPGEDFDFADYYGVTGKIVVKETESGATRVDTFMLG
jgi:hypothetical protein